VRLCLNRPIPGQTADDRRSARKLHAGPALQPANAIPAARRRSSPNNGQAREFLENMVNFARWS
jgi:hypothetical protein